MTSMTKVGLITFGESAAIALARAAGLMEAEGLDVEVTRTPSSTEQMRGLINGRWQIASTAFDNVLAWSEREGPEVVAIARAGSGVNLPVYVRPEIATWDDLRGKALAVDAVDTAFGLVLRRILQEHDLELDRDYTFVPAGATGYRLESMEKGETFAGVLNPPWSKRAEEVGMKLMARHDEVVPGYPGGGLRRKPSVGRGPPRHRRCVPACAARGDALGERRDAAEVDDGTGSVSDVRQRGAGAAGSRRPARPTGTGSAGVRHTAGDSGALRAEPAARPEHRGLSGHVVPGSRVFLAVGGGVVFEGSGDATWPVSARLHAGRQPNDRASPLTALLAHPYTCTTDAAPPRVRRGLPSELPWLVRYGKAQSASGWSPSR